MELWPDLGLGLFNGWLLAALFYLVFGILLVLFPRSVVARLYDRSGQSRPGVVRRVLGLLLFLAWLLLAILTPLRHGDAVFVVGLALYALGSTGFVVALFNYASSPADQPVTSGLYRISRHPQQFAISVSFLGISLAMGSWTAFLLIWIGIVGAHHKVLAEEKACLQTYGDSYRSYMDRVPRYFLLF
jgi:protein-S-isoprenylcysteine O-methyltransferase Ste14